MAWASIRPRQTSTLAQICRPVLALLAENAQKACHMMRRPYLLRAPVLAVGCGGRRGSIGGLVKGELLILRVLDMSMSTKAERGYCFGESLFAPRWNTIDEA